MSKTHLFLLSIFLYIIPRVYSGSQGFRVDLTHADSNTNLTKFERLQRSVQRSHYRMSRLTSKLAKSSINNMIRVPVHANRGDFIMDLSIGTPSVPFSAVLDTGSDLIWTQCKPCIECFDQPTPIFNPSKSFTYANISCKDDLCVAIPSSDCNSDSTCEYLYGYGDSSSTQGVLGIDRFRFGSASVPHIGFGCGDINQGGFSQAAGVVGLGRGPLSLISQLGLEKFSYCFTSLDDTSKKSPLLFGSLAKLKGSAVQTTPLMKNSLRPTFYYLNLTGITVGGIRLKIPRNAFALQDDGSGGIIIDSGTTVSFLDMSVYKLLKKVFLSQVKLQVADGSKIGLDLCFVPSNSTGVEVPSLIYHFDGADLDIPAQNLMVMQSGLLCLAITGSTGMSILGNIQQQNMQILYDLKKESLSFMPAQCDQL